MTQAITHALAIRVTADDVLAVLRRYSLKVANTNGKPFEEIADDIFDDLLAHTAEAAAAKHGSDRLSQESAAQASIARQLAALGVLAISEDALKAAPVPLTTAAAAALTLSHVGSFGDVYTDADESRASVAAAENISSLASRLARRTGELTFELQGALRLNGEYRAAVGVTLDGRAFLRGPSSVSVEDSGDWTVQLADGYVLNVTLFEADNEANWVVEDRDVFYNMILGEAP